jgi:hypothetical protein
VKHVCDSQSWPHLMPPAPAPRHALAPPHRCNATPTPTAPPAGRVTVELIRSWSGSPGQLLRPGLLRDAPPGAAWGEARGSAQPAAGGSFCEQEKQRARQLPGSCAGAGPWAAAAAPAQLGVGLHVPATCGPYLWCCPGCGRCLEDRQQAAAPATRTDLSAPAACLHGGATAAQQQVRAAWAQQAACIQQAETAGQAMAYGVQQHNEGLGTAQAAGCPFSSSAGASCYRSSCAAPIDAPVAGIATGCGGPVWWGPGVQGGTSVPLVPGHPCHVVSA